MCIKEFFYNTSINEQDQWLRWKRASAPKIKMAEICFFTNFRIYVHNYLFIYFGLKKSSRNFRNRKHLISYHLVFIKYVLRAGFFFLDPLRNMCRETFKESSEWTAVLWTFNRDIIGTRLLFGRELVNGIFHCFELRWLKLQGHTCFMLTYYCHNLPALFGETSKCQFCTLIWNY